MERKGSAVAVTAEEVKAALGRTRTLTSEEEKALRMRHGAPADLRAPLPSAAGQNEELKDELLVIEMQLHRAWRARMAQAQAKAGQSPVRAPAATTTNAAKDKIVRALRKKK